MTRKDKIFEIAKGFRGRASNCYKIAVRAVEKGLQHAYRGRKIKKRVARQEWITQVNAGSREHGLGYSQLMRGMVLSRIGIDRKMLAVLAQTEPYSFRAIIEECKTSLKSAVLKGPVRGEIPPSMVADANASTTVDQRVDLPRYEGPPLPPYPGRVRHFS